jgi:uncharacterized protein (DUF1501 family)
MTLPLQALDLQRRQLLRAAMTGLGGASRLRGLGGLGGLSGMSRVSRLLGLGGLGVLGAPDGALVRSAQASERPAPALVVVMLRGAVDGLSVVIPHGDPEYRRQRAEIAVPGPGTADGSAIAIDALFGLHPSLAPLMPWWQAGHLGFVHASGSPDPTRSHFDAQDHLETATPGRRSTPEGWLNRLLSQSQDSRIRGLNLGTGMPRILRGPASVGAVPTRALASAEASMASNAEFLKALEHLQAGDPGSMAAWRALQESQDALRQAQAVAGMDPGIAPGAVPLAGLVPDAARLGRVLRSQPALQVGFMSVGGWDTHVGQGGARGALANRLRLLAQGLDALAHGLGPRLQNTVILVMSEFGRTVRQNGTQGTDHGHGNVIWLLGGRVRGGQVHGVWPGLEPAALHEGRDLAITTDFRQVLAAVLSGHMGLSEAGLQTVLPDGAGRSVALDLLRV